MTPKARAVWMISLSMGTSLGPFTAFKINRRRRASTSRHGVLPPYRAVALGMDHRMPQKRMVNTAMTSLWVPSRLCFELQARWLLENDHHGYSEGNIRCRQG